MKESFIIIIRLFSAAALGGAIGYERESHNRAAGFRTHILVTIGSALIMLVSQNMGPNADSARIAAGVVSGIGFLGAGTIIRTGTTIEGLTTAASLWVCSAIGLAIGNGYYIGGVVATGIVFFFLKRTTIFDKFLLRKNHKIITIIAIVKPGLIGQIGTFFGENNINITNISLEPLNGKKDLNERMVLELKFPQDLDIEKIVEGLYKIDGINEVSLENL